MDIKQFIRSLKPEGASYEGWAAQLPDFSVASIEAYCLGVRTPKPHRFRALLEACGRAGNDAEAWAIYSRCIGIPETRTDADGATGAA